MFRFGILTRHRHTDPDPTEAEAADPHLDHSTRSILARSRSLRDEQLAVRAAGIRSPDETDGALVALGLRRDFQAERILAELRRLSDRVAAVCDAVRDRP